MRRGLMPAIVAAAVLAGASLAADADYAIKLDRPEKVGAEFHMAAAGSQTTVINATVDGRPGPQKKTDLAVDLAAGVKVLEVDKNGSPSKITLTVEKCSARKG